MSVTDGLQDKLRDQLERAYARRYGWDIDIMRGTKRLSNNWKMRHSLHGPLGSMAASDRPVHRLDVKLFGRFGNRVIQLKNAAWIAEMCGARIIRRQPAGELFRPELEHGLIVHRSRAPIVGPAEQVVMHGDFYFPESLNIEMQPDDNRRMVRKYIRPLLQTELLVPDERVGPNDMVLHFRAGDTMRGPHVHNQYGQPPVSFYLKAAELSGADRVWLVYEDTSNPAIAEVRSALQQSGKTVFCQSSSLLDDCRVILSARQFACATGTFGPVLAEISTRLRRLYAFSEFETTPHSNFHGSAVELIRINDGDGCYDAACMRGNWNASPAQIGLMLTYPARLLVVIR